MNSQIISARKEHGFLSTDELLEAYGTTNKILDASVLIADGISIGNGNIFYPNVIIERSGEGVVSIGNGNVFYPGTYIVASNGNITIGNDNEFGPGGCLIKANMPDVSIIIGDRGRYTDGVSIMGNTRLGNGSQILGSITAQSCTLAAGGAYQTPDPDERAAVLKGFGLARGIVLEKGQVVNGTGNFADNPIEWQRQYRPKTKG